jgi:hypothetical protein
VDRGVPSQYRASQRVRRKRCKCKSQKRESLLPRLRQLRRVFRAARHFAALKTRSGLRQGRLLKENLGPPLALRDPYNDEGR